MHVAAAAAHWVEHGYVLLPGYLDPEDVAPAQRDIARMFPTADEFHDDVDPERNATFRDDEFAGILTFPFEGHDATEVGLLAVHPKLVALVEAILETDDVRLYGCEAWAKYGGAAEYDQEHHRDFCGHTALVPSREPLFRQIEMFVYLDEVTPGHGPTRFVSRRLSEDLPWVPRSWSREDQPQLYDDEVFLAGPAGSVVVWSVDTFHRAGAITAPRAARFTLQANYRAGPSEWMTRNSWGYSSYYDEWYAFVERASFRQLLLFGFPPPGHAFWTPETLAAMRVRYPTLDLSPWE